MYYGGEAVTYLEDHYDGDVDEFVSGFVVA